MIFDYPQVVRRRVTFGRHSAYFRGVKHADETRAEVARRRLAALTATFEGDDEPAVDSPAPVAPKPVTNRHVVLIGALLTAAAVLSAWWILSGESEKISAPPVAVEITESAPPQKSAEVVVDVAGKVKDPGIVTLPAGARVIDALRAAGGVDKGTDTTALNKARILSDGEQILVGIKPVGGIDGPNAAGNKINLNTATPSQLEELPGVGPVTASSIIRWREEHGRFSRIEELLEVKGIGPATLAELEAHVIV